LCRVSGLQKDQLKQATKLGKQNLHYNIWFEKLYVQIGICMIVFNKISSLDCIGDSCGQQTESRHWIGDYVNYYCTGLYFP
jgi:hypothetical protein